MDEKIINKPRYDFPAYNALYHAVKGLIFMRGDFAYKVTYLKNDENNRNLKIHNESRLKERVFKEIMKKYNARINRYKLRLVELSDSRKDDVEIVKFWLVGSMDEEGGDYSGRYTIYPLTFVCSECGDFRILSKKDLGTFNPNKCRIQGCKGHYEQVSILMFCEQCGKITHLYYPCRKHGTDHLRLIRKEKDSLLTWRVVCQKCREEGKQEPIDIFRFNCSHLDENNEKICDEKERKFKPLTIKEGGVYTPVVITYVDIPSTENIDIKNLEYILLALHLGKLDSISDELKSILGRESKVDIKRIESFYKAYRDRNIRELLLPNVIEKVINIIEDTVRELKNKYKATDLEDFNDYLAVKNKESKSYEEYIKEIDNETRQEILEQNYQELKRKYGIENIAYISSINLVSSCIGIINGINKFYEEGFVPHFNPIWKNNKKKDKLFVYAYPFETEGILIDLDKIQVCNWLFNNGLIDRSPKDISEAKEILLSIKKDTEAYNRLKTLLHTLSHVLIRRSSLYTGLDNDSCSELIFVNPAAILIYSTSNINIGGFEFVFEHSLREWFRDVEFEVRECTFDLVCITEKGACFSCLYLPEFVCTEFNYYLDRDVFIGRRRYNVGYWEQTKKTNS